jgi:glycosyltransferase involved in cell wall biosynthesis
LKAIAGLVREQPWLKERLQVRLIGHTHFSLRVMDWAEQLGITENIVLTGYLDHERMVQELLIADILLLIHNSGEKIDQLYCNIPAKTYEYLGAQRPILCFSSQRIIRDLIVSLGVGICIVPLDTTEIRNAIVGIYSDYASWHRKLRNREDVRRYEARIITRELAHLLDSIVF